MSQLYPKGKQKILDGDIDFLVDDLKVCLIDVADEAYNAADEFLADVTGAAIVATSANLTGKTTTNGVFKAANTLLTSVTGDPCEAMILYKDTGSPATSPLIAFFDVATYTPSGVDADVLFNSSGLFAI